MQNMNVGTKLTAKGYDVVAYFDSVASYGDPAISAIHEGMTFYFINQDNKERFEADPQQYVPAYGGWCAYAMSEGKQFDIDPRSFKIADGQLMLFYNGVGGDTKAIWESNQVPEATRLSKAQNNWQTHSYQS